MLNALVSSAINVIAKKDQIRPLIKKSALSLLRSDWRFFQSLSEALKWKETVVKRPYAQVGWVYSSISLIAQNVARLPFRLYEGEENDPNIVESGPLYELFTNPNPFMAQETLLEATLTFLELRGECFWIIKRDNITEIPKEIWVFDPDRFKPAYNKEETALVGWYYCIPGKEKVPLALWEVLQFKHFNPYNDIRGFSTLEALTLTVEQDYLSSVYNNNFFKEGANVGGFITFPEDLDDDSFNRILAQFEDRHMGADKAHRIAILDQGAKFTEARISQRDMDFIAMKQLTREEIFGAYKVNAVVMGLYEYIQSYEGVKTAYKVFWEECLVPKLTYFEGFLWSKFFSKLKGNKKWGAFDTATVGPLMDAYGEKVVIAQNLEKMGWPINAINRRLRLGFGDVPWGDVAWKKLNDAPITNLIENEPKAVPTALPPAEDSENTDSDTDKKVTQDYRVLLCKRYLSVQTPMEKLFESKMRKFVFDQRKRVLGLPLFTNDILNKVFEEEEKRLITSFLPIYTITMKEGSKMVAEEIGLSSYTFPEEDKDYQDYLTTRLGKIPASIVQTMKKKVVQAVDGQKKSSPELLDRLRIVYNSISGRSLIIARTESSTLLSTARVITMVKEGIRLHQWISFSDERSRSSHYELDSKIVPIGNSFKSDITLRYPGDMAAPPEEVIGCRCFTIPIRKKEEV